jgi:hypothetical protein
MTLAAGISGPMWWDIGHQSSKRSVKNANAFSAGTATVTCWRTSVWLAAIVMSPPRRARPPL